MGRLVAAVIALAVFLTGAMYWSQAHQDAEAAPDGVYPCIKSTVQPAHSEAADNTSQLPADKEGSKERCGGCCCGKK